MPSPTVASLGVVTSPVITGPPPLDVIIVEFVVTVYDPVSVVGSVPVSDADLKKLLKELDALVVALVTLGFAS